MARTDQISKSLGCRLVMLFFWMVLVCSAFYASRLSKISDISVDRFQNPAAPARHRRDERNISRSRVPAVFDRCEMKPPTETDIERLRRVVLARRGKTDKGSVHCSLVNSCGGNVDNWQATCYSGDCSVFKLRSSSDPDMTPTVDAQGLTAEVRKLFQEHGSLQDDDLKKHLHVWCKDTAAAATATELSAVAVVADDVSLGSCPLSSPTPRTNAKESNVPNQHNKNQKKHIHMFYFRFLSHWEVPLRFPALTESLAEVSRKDGVNLTFDKHQATVWNDDEVLATLLQGRQGRFTFNNSLLKVLEEVNGCLRIEDLSCSSSHKQEKFLANVTSQGRFKCSGRMLRHHDSVMDRLCTSGNLTDARARAVLTSMLSSVHGLDGSYRDSRPAVSVSLLNTKDFRNSQVLDLALKYIIFSLLQDKNNIVVLLSGAGNPSLLRFDRSVSLQKQASNPVLRIHSSGDLSKPTLFEADLLNKTIFSMQAVHHFVRELIKAEAGLETPTEVEVTDSRFSVSDGSLSVWNSLGVRPPFMCLCENCYIAYENDTLMVGFAELAVGLINQKLRELEESKTSLMEAKVGKKYSIQTTFSRLDGVSFANVRAGHNLEKKQILMDLTLTADDSRDRLYRQVALELWDMEKLPKSDIHLFRSKNSYWNHHPLKQNSIAKMALSFNESDVLFKTLCDSGNTFNAHVASDSERLRQLKQRKHFGRKPTVIHVHDTCLYMLARDYGDSVSVDATNVCDDRRYDVMLHLSLMNMMTLTALPISATLGHAQTEFLTVLVKESYTVPSFAYKLHPDFTVTYDY